MKTLYWMTNDLRLDDNPALQLAAQAKELAIIYVADPLWFEPNRYDQLSMGSHRWAFIRQSLVEVDRALRVLGQQLNCIEADPLTAVSDLIRRHQFQQLVISRQVGSDEIACISQLQKEHPELQIIRVDTYTLFDQESLPMAVADVPDTYSRFRRKAEKSETPLLIDAPVRLPVRVDLELDGGLSLESLVIESDSRFVGGEIGAQEHVGEYFAGDLPLSYKLVRNSLDGWANSSKMSAWLNAGCLSARRFLHHVHRYEQTRERNDSTYWLYVELLWREYFQWLALKIGNSLFVRDGTSEQAYRGVHNPALFSAWCQGETDWPLVNACMRELNATGYLSNRGRQIAASCLINELRGDWRYGAAWFQQQLVDYDVAANWGNWQYIAGVGADARGGRHFNLAKQTEIYDADGSYRARWQAS